MTTPELFTMKMESSQAQVEGVESLTEDGHLLVTGYSIFSRISDATDARMEGALSMEMNWIDRADDVPGLGTTLYEIRNEGGRWIGSSHRIDMTDHSWHADIPLATTIAFTGMDGYEGLSAYVIGIGERGPIDETLYGVILPGEFPPVYDLPMTQCADIYPGDELCDPAWREAP